MSRVIKFRFFPVKGIIYPHGGVMRYPDSFTSVDLVEGEHWKVMQFTGILDKNGKEIYEGDVLLDMQEIEPCSVFVKWDSRYLAFMFDYGSDLLYADDVSHHGKTDMAVIGNIYEHPELIGNCENDRHP